MAGQVGGKALIAVRHNLPLQGFLRLGQLFLILDELALEGVDLLLGIVELTAGTNALPAKPRLGLA